MCAVLSCRRARSPCHNPLVIATGWCRNLRPSPVRRRYARWMRTPDMTAPARQTDRSGGGREREPREEPVVQREEVMDRGDAIAGNIEDLHAPRPVDAICTARVGGEGRAAIGPRGDQAITAHSIAPEEAAPAKTSGWRRAPGTRRAVAAWSAPRRRAGAPPDAAHRPTPTPAHTGSAG